MARNLARGVEGLVPIEHLRHTALLDQERIGPLDAFAPQERASPPSSARTVTRP
jgi:hypothetical protein